MTGKHCKALSLLVIFIFALYMMPLGISQSQTQSYKSSFLLMNKPEGESTYELNVTIPQEVYRYYSLQGHSTFSDMELAKFVTPYTLKPIADKLWQIYNNSEDFANGVLMLVHQIKYQEVVPGRYPVETFVDGWGDCDLFAYIAASILKAGGIPTILIFYRDQLHMEIGVDLGAHPREARVNIYSVNYQNVSYYIGECTGSEWRTSWRIGETPSEYQNVSSQIVPLENVDQTDVGQVSATLRELEHSTLTLKISPFVALANQKLSINGQILPPTANENVTLKAKSNGDSLNTIGTVETQEDGSFKFSWVPQIGGVLAVQASWAGNSQYNGAVSEEAEFLVLPFYIILLVTALIIVFIVFLTMASRINHKKLQISTAKITCFYPRKRQNETQFRVYLW